MKTQPIVFVTLVFALNKEKADHLRYKVEGDAVRIYAVQNNHLAR